MVVIPALIARFISFALLENFLLFHQQIIYFQLHYKCLLCISDLSTH